MKVTHYQQMMAYLTRPGYDKGGKVLPKKKPQEEIKRRSRINYEKLKKYLDPESQMFIEKELGFAIGGSVETPKRGLVDEPGSYSYSGLINELDKYLGDPSKAPPVDINDIVEKFKLEEKYKGKQYDQKIIDLKKQLRKRGYTLKTIKISPAVEYALSKSGIKVGQKNFKEANVKKLQNLYEIIEKYNARSDISMPRGTGEKFKLGDITEKKLLEEAGYGARAKTGRIPTAKYLIDNYFLTTQDKMNAELTKMLADDSTKLTDALGWTTKFSKKYNKPLRQVNQIVRDLPIYKQNRDLLNKLTHNQSVQRYLRDKNIDILELRDFIDDQETKINFSMKSFTPEQQLQSYAYKHSYQRGGKEIEWVTNPHKTPQSEWVFKYKGKIYDGDDLRRSRKDPNFAKFWKTDDQIKNYLDFKVTDPEVLKKLGFKKPTTMDQIMRRALGYGTGAKGYFGKSPMDKDHVDISRDPFDVRPMNKRINMGEGELKKRLLNNKITRAEYDQGIKKIGYEYMAGLDFDNPNTFDSVIKRDLDFAVKASQREKGFLRTPTQIFKSVLSEPANNLVKTVEELPSKTKGEICNAYSKGGLSGKGSISKRCADAIKKNPFKAAEIVAEKTRTLPDSASARAFNAATKLIKDLPKQLLTKFGRFGRRGLGFATLGLSELAFEGAFQFPGFQRGESLEDLKDKSILGLYGIGQDNERKKLEREIAVTGQTGALEYYDYLKDTARINEINAILNTSGPDEDLSELLVEKEELQKNLITPTEEQAQQFQNMTDRMIGQVSARRKARGFSPTGVIEEGPSLQDFMTVYEPLSLELGGIYDPAITALKADEIPKSQGATLRRKFMRDPENRKLYQQSIQRDNQNIMFPVEGTFAGGGIAKIAGVDSGPAPRSGPTPQGLDFLMKRGR